MALCRFSAEYVSKKTTSIDNVFLKDFMPTAPENCVKVYLFGLLKCQSGGDENSLEGFSRILNLNEDEILGAFSYWEELNLVQILSTEPFEVLYLPTKSGSINLKKYNSDKYSKFNVAMQEIITSRMILPNEFQEYYSVMDIYNIDQDAMLLIAKYCVELKRKEKKTNDLAQAKDVPYSYINAVARSWAHDNIRTKEQVENHINELELSSGEIADILSALGSKRKASGEEYQMFFNWKNAFEIKSDVLMHLAKKAKGNGGFLKLNSLVEKCYSLKLDSIKEIDNYFNNISNLKECARVVCLNLGVRYENLEIVAEEYIVPWQNLGFDNQTLETIAKYCFKSSIRTLQLMNVKINQLFKLGLVSSESINKYIDELLAKDNEIYEMLEKLGIQRSVNSFDRNLYKTWVYDWQISQELIDYASSLAVGKYMPIPYMNQIIAKFHEEKIKNVEEAKKLNLGGGKVKENSAYMKREYSNKQLNSLFDNLDEVEI